MVSEECYYMISFCFIYQRLDMFRFRSNYVLMKSYVFLDMIKCIPSKDNRNVRGKCRIQLGQRISKQKELHGFVSQKTELFITTDVIT
jgi:hypothetical protein